MPEAEFAGLVAAGTLYRVDTAASLVLARVGRDGPMKRMGHDHVIASEHVEGLVFFGDDPEDSHAYLRLPLADLAVDRPQYRERYGFDSDPDAEAIAGTTRNMHKVLETGSYPWVEVRARFTAAESRELKVSVALHGTRATFLVPVEVDREGDTLVVSGSLSMTHSEFGLTPFSAAGGMLRVAETIELDFRIVARLSDVPL